MDIYIFVKLAKTCKNSLLKLKFMKKIEFWAKLEWFIMVLSNENGCFYTFGVAGLS